MSLQGLLQEKFGNFVRRFDAELRQVEAAGEACDLTASMAQEPRKPVREWNVKDIVEHALLLQPYWGFIEEGHWDALLEMAALSENDVAEEGLMVYQNLTEGRREQLHKYLAFFLHAVQELIKNADAP